MLLGPVKNNISQTLISFLASACFYFLVKNKNRITLTIQIQVRLEFRNLENFFKIKSWGCI